MFEARQLCFGYEKNKIIIQDFSLKINAGDALGIAGKNGSGKSTVLKILSGYIKPEKGELIMNDLTKNEIGSIVDQPAVYEDLSVKNNLCMMEKLHGTKNIKYIDDKLVEHMGLLEYNNVKAKKLSFGNLQKLSIVMALGLTTKLVLLDEPFNGLDPFSKSKLVTYLIERKKQGLAIIMTSHIKGDYQLICDKIIEI